MVPLRVRSIHMIILPSPEKLRLHSALSTIDPSLSHNLLINQLWTYCLREILFQGFRRVRGHIVSIIIIIIYVVIIIISCVSSVVVGVIIITTYYIYYYSFRSTSWKY